jgi:hypothetical protein
MATGLVGLCSLRTLHSMRSVLCFRRLDQYGCGVPIAKVPCRYKVRLVRGVAAMIARQYGSGRQLRLLPLICLRFGLESLGLRCECAADVLRCWSHAMFLRALSCPRSPTPWCAVSRFAPCSAKCLVIVSGSLLAVAALFVRRSLRWPLNSPSHLPVGVLWNPAWPLDISASLIAYPVEYTGD